MKTGKIESSGKPSSDELALINKFTRREFMQDEVYTFSVILCDNDVDRDNERFTVNAINKMSELFIGKTGIFDHSQKSSDQCARIYFCEVLTDDTKKTVYGEPYTYLKAKAYMPITEKNAELITEIDAGIKKEVSIGCAVRVRKCSVCGANPDICGHKKGRQYLKSGTKTLCCHELDEPTDAYEWSFVAVPAQRAAGVTKRFSGVERECVQDILKALENQEVTLDKQTANTLYLHIKALSERADSAEEYIELQKRSVIGKMAALMTDTQTEIFKAAVDRMTANELFELAKSLQADDKKAVAQLRREKDKKRNNQNKEFMI